MHRVPVLLFLLVSSAAALATPPLAQSGWEGTWSTTHGELRIVSIGAFVVGDYADRGTLVGQLSGRTLTGTFTNGGRAGTFTFRSDGTGAFSGSWGWAGEAESGSWNGTRTATESPALTNFSRDGRALRSLSNSRDVYNGTYDGTFGEVRLRSADLVLVGDYGDLGVMAGMWDGNGFVGTFTNGARAGWFDFEFLSRTGDFRAGQWGWAGGPSQGAWTLRKTDASTPSIRNLRRRTAPAPSPDPSRPSPPPAEPHAATRLSPTSAFTMDKLRTILAMQHHVQFVSEEDASVGEQNLRDAGFDIQGGRFIDTEASGLGGIFTTGRLRAYVATRGTDVVIAFRGSGGSNLAQTIGNGGTDALAVKARADFIENGAGRAEDREARMHAGFVRAYERLRPEILAAVDAAGGRDVYVFGHSLGGALATLCALDLAISRRGTFRSITHIVSGSPRVGNGPFRSLFERGVPNNLRITIHGDPVPRVPRGRFTDLRPERYYRHVGRLLPLTESGDIQAADDIATVGLARFGRHSNSVYLNAVVQLVREAERSPSVLNVDLRALGDAEREKARD